MDLLLRNKKYVGLVFGIFGAYVWNSHCPGLEKYCVTFGIVLSHLGSFLVGAGVLPADNHVVIKENTNGR